MVIASGFVNLKPNISPTLTAVITSSNKHKDIIKVGGFISPLLLLPCPHFAATEHAAARAAGRAGQRQTTRCSTMIHRVLYLPSKRDMKVGPELGILLRREYSSLGFWLVLRHQWAIRSPHWLISWQVKRPLVGHFSVRRVFDGSAWKEKKSHPTV